MILSCHEIRKEYSGEPVLTDVSCTIGDAERVALIGANGAGKTTLLRMLAGQESPDAGTITLSPGRRVGYLPQHAEHLPGDGSLLSAMRDARADLFEMEEGLRQLERAMDAAGDDTLPGLLEDYHRLTETFEAAGGYRNQSDITGVLKGLGFSEAEFDKPLSVLSGGERQRAALGSLLLRRPDLLLLDEPTNHLDLDSIAWLESYLLAFSGAMLVVSHDRYFLDRIAQKVVEIEAGKSLSFAGNYTQYSEKKAALRHAQLAAWQKQQAEIKHQEEVITKLRSFNREKSIKRAESREKVLAKMDRVEKPAEIRDDMRLRLDPKIQSGNDVLQTEDLAKGYGDRTLFSDLQLRLTRGERVAVIGQNGTGKTTLLRILTGMEKADRGDFTLGTNVRVGYYDQEQQNFHMEKTLFDEISDDYPRLTGTEIRNVLAAFLFTGDDVFRPVSVLSGGEKGRLSLAKLMLSGANFLILDEPTNHLDITSREILEDTLSAFSGTILVVSHDRYFVNRVATRVLELFGGAFTSYPGNYDDYLEKRSEKPARDEVAAAPETTAAKADWLNAKQEAAERRKREAELRAVEEEIEELEARLAEIDQALLSAGSDHAKCAELAAEKTGPEARLEELMCRWEALQESSSPTA